MTKYIVKLTEQEELTLRKLALQPGFEVIFKLLQGESLDAQSKAMDCKGTREERLLALSDAQSTKDVVSSLTRKLTSYREVVQPLANDRGFEIISNIWNEEETPV